MGSKLYLYIVPRGPPEHGCIDGGEVSHGPVGQVVRYAKLVVEELGDVVVEPGNQGEPLLVPVVVLQCTILVIFY